MMPAIMFERYNEKARRVVFYARHFASELGGSLIEPEHILLAILQEEADLFLPWLRSQEQIDRLRDEVREQARGCGDKPTSADMYLSDSGKRVLAYACEEAERLHQGDIRPSHLLAGLLRERDSPVAGTLRKYGVDIQNAKLVFVASSQGQVPVQVDSQDVHRLVDQLPPSELVRAQALLQAILESNRPASRE